MITFTTYLERHERRRLRAWELARLGPRAAAEALASALGLHPATAPALAVALARSSTPPAPGPANLLRPAADLPVLPVEKALDLHFREQVCRRSSPLALEEPDAPLAWRCAALLGHAQDHLDLDQDAWAEVAYGAHERDAATSKLLRQIARGELWEILDPLARLSWPVVRGVFRVGMRARGLPAELQRRALERLGEEWPYSFVIGGEGRPAALPEVLLRAVETLGGAEGPALPVARLMDADGWERLASELAQMRWRGPLSRIYRVPRGKVARVAAVAACWREDPARFQADMRAVMALRLLSFWAKRPEIGFPAASWRRVEAGQSRGRARLRAAASPRVAQSCAALLGAPAPYARLMAGLRRYAYALFFREAEDGFAGSSSAAPTPPGPPIPGLRALLPDAEAMGSLRAWALLCVLRGDGALLAGWRDRTVGKTAGSWDRRKKELPANLRNPPRRDVIHELARLSLALMRAPELISAEGAPGEELIAYLQQVALLDPDKRTTLAKIKEILREAAAPGQGPEPGGGAPGMVTEARRWTPRRKGKGGGR